MPLTDPADWSFELAVKLCNKTYKLLLLLTSIHSKELTRCKVHDLYTKAIVIRLTALTAVKFSTASPHNRNYFTWKNIAERKQNEH